MTQTEAPMVGRRARPGAPGDEPPLQDILVELWENVEKLLRQEIALARAELDLKAQKLQAELTGAAMGGALMLAGALALVAAVVLLLALIMPAWTASLVTGVAAGGAGLGLVRAKKPSTADLEPERTIHSLKKDLQTFMEPTK